MQPLKATSRLSASKMSNHDGGMGTSNVSSSKRLVQGVHIEFDPTRSKRSMNSTNATVIKVEDGSSHFKKRKGKVGDSHVTREPSLSKRIPHRRNFRVRQQYERSRIDLEKGNQLTITNSQGPKRKRITEATCNVECQRKGLTKPRNLPKAKSRFLPQLARIREETSVSSCLGPDREDLTQEVYSSSMISENEKDTLQLQNKELIHSKSSLDFKVWSSQHPKLKTKRKGFNIKRSQNNTHDKTRTRKITLKEKSRAHEKHRNGSHGLHSLKNPTLSRKPKNRCMKSNDYDLGESTSKEQLEGILNNDKALEINSDTKSQSKATATALKVASETSGFVRTTLKAVEYSKIIHTKHKGVPKRQNEDVTPDNKPNEVLDTVATRYKSTLESLQISKTLTAEKLIEELGAIQQLSEGNATKTRKYGKRHTGRSTRTTFKKDLKDGPIGRDNKEDSQPKVFFHRKPNARFTKLGKKMRKTTENQMDKHGCVDKVPQNQGLNATKKSQSPMVSGFDRLVSGASKDKEFEIALAQIVSSHNDEIGWTKDQEKALQSAYLNKKQPDDDFWHLLSKEVPGKSAKECCDKFYSRSPVPSIEAQAQVPIGPNEVECSPTLSNPLHTKTKGTGYNATKHQKDLKLKKTFRNILGHVDSMEVYKTENCNMENIHLNAVLDVGSVLDRAEDEKAVILQSNCMKDYNTMAPFYHVGEDAHNKPAKTYFENVVISGVRTYPDKENNQPPSGIEINHKKLGVPRVELILKQVDNGEHLPYDSRPKTTTNTNTNRKKKKIIKTNNIYLHSKDALDFGDTTLDAIHRAKQELRNVFSSTGSRKGSFFDDEAD